jgi:hypothetical protein
MPEITLTRIGAVGPVQLSHIQAFLLDVQRHRLVVLQGSTAHSKPKYAHGVTDVEVANPEDWATLKRELATYYGLATGFALEEIELGGVDREL